MGMRTILLAAVLVGVLLIAGCAGQQPAGNQSVNKSLGDLPNLPSPNPLDQVAGAGGISSPDVVSSPV